MTAPTSFEWSKLEPGNPRVCVACEVYWSDYAIEFDRRGRSLGLCRACAGRLRSTTKAIQRDIQANATPKVRP